MANSNLVTREDLKNVFEALGANAFNDYITTQTFTGSATFNNTNYGVGSINIAKGGYKPLGVVQISPADNTVIFTATKYTIENNTLTYTLRRIDGAVSTTVTSHFTILYVKDTD